MKVYVITQGEYSDYHIVGVTLDKEVAEKCVKVHSRERWSNPRIEVYDTDEFRKYTKPCWIVDYDDMTVERYQMVDGELDLQDADLFGYDFIYADTEQHAIKIAGERKAKMLAERAGL